ncbi:MAG TPA: hypothetical protein VGH38_01110 [Bryobacteraceae bacterium]
MKRSFAWLVRNRRLSKDYEYLMQGLQGTFIDIAAAKRGHNARQGLLNGSFLVNLASPGPPAAVQR